MMKKTLFYMMAAAIASGMTACSSQEDGLTESSAEQTFTSPYATIRASFGEENATTRVAMNGLSLSWSEGDAIGVVYTNNNRSGYEIFKYNYRGGGEFVVDESQESDLETYSTPMKLAFYPYSSEVGYQPKYGLNSFDIGYYDTDADTDLNQIKVPLISKDDFEDGVYTFTAACGIFAVKVRNFKAGMGYTKASLYNSTSGEHSGGWFYDEWSGLSDGYKYDFDLTKVEDGNPTFYFPLATDIYYDDLTFALSNDDGTQRTGFKLSDRFEPDVNVKYAKVIELESDATSENYGRRKDDAITLAKCELEVSNTVEVDLTDAASEETFYIPESVKGGTSVDITASNAQENRTVYLKQEEGVNIAKDVNLYYNEHPFYSSFTINLPKSNVYVDSDTPYTEFYGALIVERAKSFTWGENMIASMSGTLCFKEVSEVTVDGFSFNGNTIEGSATGEESRTMTLTINHEFADCTITGNIILTVVNNNYQAATFNGYTITAPAHATTVLHIKDGKWVED
jgi:hypothetical protein